MPTCDLPAEKGPCRAIMSRWYYDSELERCVKLVYGGCRGNANNFASEYECMKRCSPTGPEIN